MKKEQKIKEVEELKQKFVRSKAVLFAQNKGLKVSQMTDLRRLLKKEQASIKVVKNRLLKRALSEGKIAGLEPFIEGAVALTAVEGDPVSTAKILVEFVKGNEAFVLKGGYVDGKAVPLDQIRALASLPSKEELYGMLLYCLQGPARGFVTVLSAVPRNLVNVLEAIKKQKGG